MMIFWTLLLGVLYPLAVTGVAQVLMPHQANGSLLADGKGSALIGQSFTSKKYFWGRMSATDTNSTTGLSDSPYDAASSSGSNWGPTDPKLKAEMAAGAARFAPATSGIPADLVTSSASGLDPDVTPEAALYQVARVAKARGLSEAAVTKLVESHTEQPGLGALGHARVNVLLLNEELDRQK
jgi:K+-transporting ATPase ATPase C chain